MTEDAFEEFVKQSEKFRGDNPVEASSAELDRIEAEERIGKLRELGLRVDERRPNVIICPPEMSENNEQIVVKLTKDDRGLDYLLVNNEQRVRYMGFRKKDGRPDEYVILTAMKRSIGEKEDGRQIYQPEIIATFGKVQLGEDDKSSFRIVREHLRQGNPNLNPSHQYPADGPVYFTFVPDAEANLNRR